MSLRCPPSALLATLLGALLLAGCAGPSSHRSAAPEAPQLYPVKGVIQRLEPDGRTVVIKHEAIPGYMAAMTMPFEVKDPQELTGLQPGDQVSFVMCVTETDGWIENIAKVGASAPYEAKPRPAVRIARIVDELAVGDLMPNYPFTNELNRAVSLHQFQGEVYALTFIYTRCPYPTFCPRMTSHFADVSRLLLERKDAPSRWRLLSLSFDPDHDTPARLRAYALRHDYDPKRWSFLTGAMIEIDAITEQFGMVLDREGDYFSHNVRTVVVGPDGRIRNILIGNSWKPQELAEAMVEATRPKPASPGPAPQRSPSNGAVPSP